MKGTRILNWVHFLASRHSPQQVEPGSLYRLLFDGEYLSLSMALTMGTPPPPPILSYPFLCLACCSGDLDLAEAAARAVTAGGGSFSEADWAGCTAAHYAALCGHVEVLEMLEREGGGGAWPRNRYDASPRDYLALGEPPGDDGAVLVWKDGELSEVKAERVARELLRCESFSCSGRCTATGEYLEKLLLPTLGLHSVKVPEVITLEPPPPGSSMIDTASTCLALVSEEVGWGVFATRHIAPGECFARYGGVLDLSTQVRASSAYIVKGTFPGTLLDGEHHRSIGATINHSGRPNAKLMGFFEKGADVTVAVALIPIERGQQIVIDYGKDMTSFPVNEGQEGLTIPLPEQEDEVA
jgi:hypothetical protein